MIIQNIIFTFIVLILMMMLLKSSNFFIDRKAEQKQSVKKRIYYVTKFVHFIIYFIALMIIALIWNVQLGGITVFASSIFAVIGMALFAQWSVLSNITSSIIIFFTFPARIGDKIKIVDGENSIIGEIIEISLFHIEIIDEEENKVLYPNNLFIQKPVKYLKTVKPKKKYI